MTFLAPGWLMLALPAALVWWWFRPTDTVLRVLRAVVLAAVILAAAEPVVQRLTQAGTVIVIADRSASMPQDAAQRQFEIIETLKQSSGENDRIGLIGFAKRPTIETTPGKPLPEAFQTIADPSATSLADAIRRALTIIPESEPARLLVLSDGRATDAGTQAAAAAAASRSIAIDYRHLARSTQNDTAIAEIAAPSTVGPADRFLIHANISTPTPGPVRYELRRAGTTIALGEQDLSVGVTRLTFRDTASASGPLDYTLRIIPDSGDPAPENNTARFIVGRTDAKRLLVISNTPTQGLAQLLTASGIDADVVTPNRLNPAIESLAQYSALVLENVPASSLPNGTLDNIAILIEKRGTGLLMTGGKRSYAAGGYFGSPLEPILPVSMELRSEFRQLTTAIVVALDRSGSMAAVVGDGRTKMQLAGMASAKVLELLTDVDAFGAIAIDSAPHTVVPLSPVSEVRNQRSTLRRLESMGGGIYVYEALLAATRMLADSEAASRHIILFADAQDAEQPGDYLNLLARATEAGITCSVVGLGRPGDVDGPLLEAIAAAGDGRVFFTEDPSRLPEIFTEDAVAVTRGAFLEQPTSLNSTAELFAILQSNPGPLPTTNGYNPLFIKEGARVAVQTVDEYRVPFVASWNAGLGRVITYAGEADGVTTGNFAQWENVGSFWAALVRAVTQTESDLGPDLLVQQRIEAGELIVDLNTDPGQLASVTTPTLELIKRAPDGTLTTENVPLRFDTESRLRARVTLDDADTVIPTLTLGDGRRAALTPTRLPYPPEFAPAQDDGATLLERIARRTEGRERPDVSSIWQDLPEATRQTPLAPFILSLAVIAMLAEVAQRRLAVVSLSQFQRKPKQAKGRLVVNETRQAAGDTALAPRTPLAPVPKPAGHTAALTRTATPDAPRDDTDSGVLGAISDLGKKP